jgi:hypothetical protein
MDGISFFIFFTFVILIFFGISISAIIVWVKSFKKTKEILKNPNEHWSLKGFIYYGIFFTIFIIFSVFVSLVVGLGLFIWSLHV